MNQPLVIDVKHTAVLVLDYQVGVASMLSEPEPLLARARSVLEAARAAELPVVYVVVQFRPGYPEISPRNTLMTDRIKRSGRFLVGSPEVQVVPAVTPREGDVVVTKHRIGALSGTELDALLRSRQIETLVLFGIVTSGTVLTTVRQAFDADYRLMVVRDCCSDLDLELHSTLMDKVIGRQAQLTTAEELCAHLQGLPRH